MLPEDIELIPFPASDTVPVKLVTSSYSRSTAPSFVPRFNTGKKGDNDDDLTQHKTITFAGGELQIIHKDDTQVRSLDAVYNRTTDDIFPLQLPTSITVSGASTSASYVSAWATNNIFTLVAVREAGTTTKLYKITSAGVLSVITLPVAISGSTVEVMDIVFHGAFAFLCGQNATTQVNCHRYDYNANTWQDITGGIVKWAVIRNVLYGVSRVGVFSATNEFAASAATWTLIKNVGPSDPNNDFPSYFQEFNGAGWIVKPSGLYRFDGVDIVRILEQKLSNLCRYNGALYYTLNDRYLYRFDGTNIELLYTFDNDTYITSLAPHNQYLSILFYKLARNSSGVLTGLVDYYAKLYDGESLFGLMKYVTTQTKEGLYPLVSGGTRLFLMYGGTTGNAYSFFSYDTNPTSLFAVRASASSMSFTTSDIDCDTPSLFKGLERIELDFEGLTAGDTIKFYRQFFSGTSWATTWTQIGGDITTSTTMAGIQMNGRNAFSTSSETSRFKKVRFRVDITTASSSTLKLRSFSFHYVVTPRLRYRWQIGVKSLSNMVGNNGQPVSQNLTAFPNTVVNTNYLYGRLMDLFGEGRPFWLRDVDYNLLNASFTNVATSFVLQGHAPAHQTYPFIEQSGAPLFYLVLDTSTGNFEVFRVSSITPSSSASPTATVNIVASERGLYSYNWSFTNNATTRAYPLRRVVMTNLVRDVYVPTPTTLLGDNDGASPTHTLRDHDLLFELTEV